MGVTATFFDGDTSFLFLFIHLFFLRKKGREKGADGGAGEWKRKGAFFVDSSSSLLSPSRVDYQPPDCWCTYMTVPSGMGVCYILH